MPHRSILLVDDNPALVNAYQIALEECGFAVTTATNGGAAVASFSPESQPAVAVVDLRMEEMDGPDTIQVLQEQRPELKFIVMSGQMLSPYFRRLADLGVRHFLPKPFKIDDLIGDILELA